MDVAGSFLELSCVRVALLPVGAPMTDHRFEELTAHLTAFRELPVSALPRQRAVPRTSGNATFSAMPTAFRAALAEASSPPTLPRSRSVSRDVGIGRPPSTSTSTSSSNPSSASIASLRKSLVAQGNSPPAPRPFIATRVAPHAVSFRKTRAPPPVSPRHTADLDMTRSDVDSSFRLRYDIVYRDHSGALIMKPFSEWDDFHSSKMWGIFGIVDCTQPGVCDDAEERQRVIIHAYDDFRAALPNFKHAAVRRLIVFTAHNAEHESGPFLLNDPKSSVKDVSGESSNHFSVGYVPEHEKAEETRLEVKAQIINFAGLLLHAIDLDCWKKGESAPTDLFRSPIDEKHTADRQSKLAKRRGGRLDKLLGDSFLLMGNPREALSKYNSAMEKAKANSDRLYLAGAMEGWSAARVLKHVGDGGSVGDKALSDELIEHYAEIYKLYQKKRVAEPEAAAALRLAEFLGKWTNRRKDALDAAEHAATVGEGLRIQKRAALWEALARFSERMGCRRKAALFLYRLGLLHANQSVWSAAVTLMIASERQLSRDGQKPWASLNRNVLLNAAHYADEAGDVNTVARLYAEALVIAPSGSHDTRQGDENIVSALTSSQIPAYLPATKDILFLKEITALQLHGLSIHAKASDDSELQVASRDGPFIYNPFEARKRAEAAANALRAVTWVCGEAAQISVHLVNGIGTDLVAHIIAVVLSEKRTDAGGMHDTASDLGSNVLEIRSSGAPEEENASAEHTKRVREILSRSNRIAETIPETFTIPPHAKAKVIVKQMTVIPKRTGAILVQGLLVRLFDGAIVILRAAAGASGEAPPVNVMGNLPRIHLSCHSAEGGSIENLSNGAPLTVFEGERRSCQIYVKDTGKDRIIWVTAKVSSSNPDTLEVTNHELSEESIRRGLKGGKKSKYMVEVLGKSDSLARKHPSRSSDTGLLQASKPISSVVSVSMEYEGEQSPGTIRESTTVVRIVTKPAVRIASILVLESPLSPRPGKGSRRESTYCVAVEVRNEASAPANVNLLYSKQGSAPACGDLQTFSNTECFIETGASARLICALPNYVIQFLRKKLAGKADQMDSADRKVEDRVFDVKWRLSALGRVGTLGISNNDLWRAVTEGKSCLLSTPSKKHSMSYTRHHLVQAELTVCLNGEAQSERGKSVNETSSTNATTVAAVNVGRFCAASIHVRNVCEFHLPEHTVLDVDLLQMDDHGHLQKVHRAVVVGAVERVTVGALQPLAGTFSHSIGFKVPSAGTFHLQACLYDGSEAEASASDSPATVSTNSVLLSAKPTTEGQLDVSETSRAQSPSKLGPLQVPASPSQGTSPHARLQQNLFQDSPRGILRSSESPRPLKRVGLPRRKKPELGNSTPSVGLIDPTTIDSYPETAFRRNRSHVLACSVLVFTALKGSSSIALG